MRAVPAGAAGADAARRAAGAGRRLDRTAPRAVVEQVDRPGAAGRRTAAARLAGQAARLPAAGRRGDRRRAGVRRRRRRARARTPSPPPVALLERTGLDLRQPLPAAGGARRDPAGPAAAAVVLAHLPAAAAGRAQPAAVAVRRQRPAARGHAARRTTGRAVTPPCATEVVEDVALLRAVKRTGGRGGVVDGTALATTRMYDGWAELAAGYGKSLHTVPLATSALLAAAVRRPAARRAARLAGRRRRDRRRPSPAGSSRPGAPAAGRSTRSPTRSASRCCSGSPPAPTWRRRGTLAWKGGRCERRGPP